jgi:hypothetical protein
MRHLLLLLLVTSVSAAQTPEEREVRAVIDRLFEGMRNADTAVIRPLFAPNARFALLDNRSTPPGVRYDTVGSWINGVANSAKRWDEQIYDVQVRVDGNMAHVWAPYTFYLDKKWRHCGTDSVELLKIAGAWKITQLSDTQRREGCRDPLGTGPLPRSP